MKHFNRKSCFTFWKKSACYQEHRFLWMRTFFYMLYLLPIEREDITRNLETLALREVFLIIF